MRDTLQLPPPRRLHHLTDGAGVDAAGERAYSPDVVGRAVLYAASWLFLVPRR